MGIVIDAYDPSIITIGGTVALKNKDLMLEPIKRYVSDYAINKIPKILISPLGEDVILYGAIAMAFKFPF